MWEVTSSPPPPYVFESWEDWQRHAGLTRPWQRCNSYLHAVYHGDLRSIEQHLENGCDVDTGLPMDPEEHLLEELPLDPDIQPTDPTYEDYQPETALGIAVTQGLKMVVLLLLERGADVGRCGGSGCFGYPLMLAAKSGNVEIVEILLHHGAPERYDMRHDTLGCGIYCMTPLLAMAFRQQEHPLEQHLQVAKLLLDRGHKMEFTTEHRGFKDSAPVKREASALFVAATFGNETLTDLFLARGANANFVAHYDSSESCLLSAAYWGYTNIARSLLQYGADATFCTPRGTTPLNCAARKGNAELIRILVEHGAEPKCGELHGRCPLDDALGGGHIEAASELMRLGASVDSMDQRKVDTVLEHIYPDRHFHSSSSWRNWLK